METLYPLQENQVDNYQSLLDIIPFYIKNDEPFISNLSNFVSLVNYYTHSVNWVGVYLNENETLYVGPFQGKPACSQIEKGRGVCGTAFLNEKTVRVDDVNLFEGHIACDDASLSEIVIPIIQNGNFLGVLDIDAPLRNRFDDTDQTFLEKAVKLFIDTAF